MDCRCLRRQENYIRRGGLGWVLEQEKDIGSDNTHQPKLNSNRAVVEPVEFTAHQNKGEWAPWSNMKHLSKRGLERTSRFGLIKCFGGEFKKEELCFRWNAVSNRGKSIIVCFSKSYL